MRLTINPNNMQVIKKPKESLIAFALDIPRTIQAVVASLGCSRLQLASAIKFINVINAKIRAISIKSISKMAITKVVILDQRIIIKSVIPNISPKIGNYSGPQATGKG